MKPWIIEISSPAGVAFTEPVDDVTATLLLGLGMTGAFRARQLYATRSQQRQIVGLVHSGQLAPRSLQLRIGTCAGGQLGMIRAEEIRVAAPPMLGAGLLGQVALVAGVAGETGGGETGGGETVQSVSQLQQALPALPVVGGWPLLDQAPSEPPSAPSEEAQLVVLRPAPAASLVERLLEWLLGAPRGSEVTP